MHRYALAAAFMLALAAPALAAEFYVTLDTATNECRVVTERTYDRSTVVKDDSSPSLKMVGSGANAASAAFLPSRQRAWRSASVMALLPFGLRPRFIFVTPPMRISRMWERTAPGGPMSSQQIFNPTPT